MQILSLGGDVWLAQTAAPPVGPGALLSDVRARIDGAWPWLLALLVLGQFIEMVCYWLAAKPLAEYEETRFGNAVKVWASYFFFSFVFGVGLGLLSPRLALLTKAGSASNSTTASTVTVTLVLLAVIVVVFIVALFAVPIRIYRLTFGGAVLFLIFSIILSVLANGAVQLVFYKPLQPMVERFRDWRPGLAPGIPSPSGGLAPAKVSAFAALEQRAADRSKSPQERQKALLELYNQLEAWRQTLHAAPPGALAEYEQRKARYEQLLSDLRAEVAGRR